MVELRTSLFTGADNLSPCLPIVFGEKALLDHGEGLLRQWERTRQCQGR